jgi:NAD(P)-dependent dehydrogenase (short-subunit alcohol dehydrogenase family)
MRGLDCFPVARLAESIDATMIITGGGRGIGAATARLGAMRGDAVIVNYVHDETTAEAVTLHIRQCGGKAVAVQADVSREIDVARLFETADREFGNLDSEDVDTRKAAEFIAELDGLADLGSVDVFATIVHSYRGARLG